MRTAGRAHPQLKRCGLIEAKFIEAHNPGEPRHPQLKRCGLIEACPQRRLRSLEPQASAAETLRPH